MNLRMRSFVAIPLTALLWVMLPSLGRADSTYSYTSPLYTSCTGTYASSGTTCAGPYALSITFTTATPLTDGMSLQTIPVSSFSITDGTGLLVNSGNAASFSFQIGTDASGDIDAWSITAATPYNASNPIYYFVQSLDTPTTHGSASETTIGTFNTDGALVSQVGGVGSVGPSNTWMIATPEPSSLVLISVGLLAFGLATFWRKPSAQSVGA